MLLGTLGASLLGNLLSGKEEIWANNVIIKAGDGIKREMIFNAASFFD